MTRHLIFVVLIIEVSVWMIEAKAVPAIKRRPSLSNMRSLFSSSLLEDEMVPAVPAMMAMMPSYVYYHVVSPFHSPFHRMAQSMVPMWSKFGFESSEEEDEEEEAEESKKIEKISKVESKKLIIESEIDKASSAEEKEFPQEEEETQTENEERVTESVTEETQSIDGNEDQVTTTEFPANTESTDPQTSTEGEEENNSSVTEATTTTEFQQMDDKAVVVVEDKLSTTDSRPVKTSSTTYVCKHGKCQHTMEAKKLLEQEIEAELWAKL